MLTWFLNRSASRRRASELYGAVVAFARRPFLYSEIGVADTPDGRYEMLVLHLFLVLERLRAAGEAGVEPSRTLIEAFVTDIDDNMREMGVGDLSVPKKVKKAAAAFYDRTAIYRAALRDSNGGELAATLGRLVPAAHGRILDERRLAQTVRSAEAHLAALSLADVLAGRLPA